MIQRQRSAGLFGQMRTTDFERPEIAFSPSLHLRRSGLTEGLGQIFYGFDAQFGSASHRIRLGIGDVAFDVRSDDAEYLQKVANAVGLCTGQENEERRIFVDSRGLASGRAWPTWSEQFYNEREVEACLAEGRYRLHYFDELDFWQIYERDKGRGTQIMRGRDQFPRWDPGSPLRNLLHWGLLESGLGFLHAGSLSVEDTGVLLAGAGGAGKSGTVAAGILNGLGTVGDDYVAVGLGKDVRAYAAFTQIKQDPAGISRLGSGFALPDAAQPNWQGKHLIRVDDIARDQQPGDIRIGAILLPKISHGRTTNFLPATAREAFLALAPSGITQIPSARAEMFAFCARLTRKLPAFHLALSEDPVEITDRIGAFCRDLPS